MTKKRIVYNKIKEDKKRYVYFIWRENYENRENITYEDVYFCVVDNEIITNEKAWEEFRNYMKENEYYSANDFILFSTDKDLFDGAF